MRLARVSMLSATGREVWRGSLRSFLRGNGYGRADARAIIAQLRGTQGGALVFGGGAVAISYVLVCGSNQP